ncbi:MAG: hypothetical protein WAQ05_04390 [Rubrivivax sp.]
MTPAPLQLLLTLDDDALSLAVHNAGVDELRLWQHDNACGWAMFSLHVDKADGGFWTLQPQARRWTRHLLRSQPLAPGATLQYRLPRGAPAWTGLPAGEAWRLQALQVQLLLQQHGGDGDVTPGLWRSTVCTSTAPHRWLVAASA